MTTATLVTERQTTDYISERRCEGCPRCQDPNAGFCKLSHPKWKNLHPICRRCGHCVLRGSHVDNTDDLKET